MPAWYFTLVTSVFTSEKLVSVAWDLLHSAISRDRDTGDTSEGIYVIVQPIICLTQCSAGTKIDRLELAP